MNNPSYRDMYVILTSCLRQHAGRTVIALLLCKFLQMLATVMGAMPIMSSFSSDGTVSAPSIQALALCLLLQPVVYYIVCTLTYGLLVLLTRLREQSYVTIGYLFIGFKDPSWRILKTSLMFSVGYMMLLVILAVCTFVFYGMHSSLPLIFAAILCVLLLLFWHIPFWFTYLQLYEDKALSVLVAFKQGLHLTRKHGLHFFGFLLRAGGRDFCATVFLNIVISLVPQKFAEQASFALLLLFLNFMALVTLYRTLVRFYFAIVIYYHAIQDEDAI